MNPSDILKQSSVTVSPEAYTLVSLSHESWKLLLANPELSPRMTSPFMIFMDKHEVTLLLDEIDFENIRSGIGDPRLETGFRMLTFETVLDFDLVGFISEVSRILADAEISILPIAAFSRDHVLIKQADLAKALKALGPHVAELC